MKRLGKRAVFSEAVIKRAEGIVGDLSYNEPVLSALVVLLSGKVHLTAVQISQVLSISKATVVRMGARFRQAPDTPTKKWGGNRRELLDATERQAVLATLTAAAKAGQIVVVASVKSAIEEQCGKQVSLQTAYNVLHREGWRKVRPDKFHPKGNPLAQETFKKKPSPRNWQWLPPRLPSEATPSA
jgi:transposase